MKINKKLLILHLTLILAVIAANVEISLGQSKNTEFPQTPLGKIAGEWIEVINHGDETNLRTFIENRFSGFALKQQTPETLLALFRNLQKQSGGVEVVQVSPNTGEVPLSIIIKSKTGSRYANVIMGLNAKEGKLAGLGIRKIENPGEKWNQDVSGEGEMIAEIKRQAANKVKNGDFSGVVFVAKNDRILINEAYGYADREAKTPNTSQTRFHIASVGKMFTSVAIATLVKSGKISYTDTVAKLMPGYPNQEIAKKITVHQLLTHTAGLGTFFESPGFNPKTKYRNSTEEIAVYRDESLFFEPGAKWRYSNAGYSLLGAIIERVSGKSYLEFIRENVLIPLEMNDTDTDSNETPAKNGAVLYQPTEIDPFGFEPLNADRNILFSQATGFGGGFSTVADLFKFARAYQTGKFLGRELTDKIVAPKVAGPPNENWGYGIATKIINGETVRGHSGGGRADVAILWNSGYIVIVLVNVIPPTAASLSGKIVEYITGYESIKKKAN